jgi:para-nitrobenzyl esterase
LQYERAVQAEFGMDAIAILGLYPAAAFPTPKEALARLTTDVEFVCEARRIARVMHYDGAPVFLYSFDHVVAPVNAAHAVHGLETNILFGNNFGAPSNHVLDAADTALFRAMSTYWRDFAETGRPSAPGHSIPWPPFRIGSCASIWFKSTLRSRVRDHGDAAMTFPLLAPATH